MFDQKWLNICYNVSNTLLLGDYRYPDALVVWFTI